MDFAFPSRTFAPAVKAPVRSLPLEAGLNVKLLRQMQLAGHGLRCWLMRVVVPNGLGMVVDLIR